MAPCRKKIIFSFLGYCYFNLRGGLGVRGGEGGYLEYKILHRKFAICQYFRDKENDTCQVKLGLESRLRSHNRFFCERDIELGELGLSLPLRTSSPWSYRGRERRKRSKARRRGRELRLRSDFVPNRSSIGMRLLPNLVLDVDRVDFLDFF